MLWFWWIANDSLLTIMGVINNVIAKKIGRTTFLNRPRNKKSFKLWCVYYLFSLLISHGLITLYIVNYEQTE